MLNSVKRSVIMYNVYIWLKSKMAAIFLYVINGNTGQANLRHPTIASKYDFPKP